MVSYLHNRKYSEDYIKFGFIYIERNNVQLPQCLICYKTLGNDSLKPCKLKAHLEKCHPELKDKPTEYFQLIRSSVEKAKNSLDSFTGKSKYKSIYASYLVAYRIAKVKKPHIIAEQLILPCCIDICIQVIGEKESLQLSKVPLSNNAISRRIKDISNNIRELVVEKIRKSPFFAIQLDETTDVSSLSQLLVYVRYIYNDELITDFLFCKPLFQTTTAIEIYCVLDEYLNNNNIKWINLAGLTTDGAPAMLGVKSGLQALI